ncbi:PREDICTED: uncharacterized protein LOC105455979 [Wasmannia auropunctata]|uniref:uncharacterized protein LOC105455979 n=1 Tax=Wasmannia auropunctata TaxID=64793 RepID=UPI0005EFCCDE|nr:PREDICTED: uncharacterized protein LOC105455979 [Wasmannia auropunctata]
MLAIYSIEICDYNFYVITIENEECCANKTASNLRRYIYKCSSTDVDMESASQGRNSFRKDCIFSLFCGNYFMVNRHHIFGSSHNNRYLYLINDSYHLCIIQ